MKFGLPVAPHKKILWIEDDLRFVSRIIEDMQQRYSITHISTFTEKTEFGLDYHAALVDLSVINQSFGEKFILFLKERQFSGAIFVFSSDESINTKLRFLKLGVDDYFWKTMPIDEVFARIDNALTQHSNRKNPNLSRAGLDLDLLTQKAWLDKNAIHLTRSEFRLVVQLIRSEDQRCHFAELSKIVWEQEFVDRGAQDTLIWKLNKKLNNWPLRVRRTNDCFELYPKNRLEDNSGKSFIAKFFSNFFN